MNALNLIKERRIKKKKKILQRDILFLINFYRKITVQFTKKKKKNCRALNVVISNQEAMTAIKQITSSNELT